jgi:hypothetical protein
MYFWININNPILYLVIPALTRQNWHSCKHRRSHDCFGSGESHHSSHTHQTQTDQKSGENISRRVECKVLIKASYVRV